VEAKQAGQIDEIGFGRLLHGYFDLVIGVYGCQVQLNRVFFWLIRCL
jgi:hypothetical protein